MKAIILGLDVHGIEIADRLTGMDCYQFLGYIASGGEWPERYGGHPVLGGVDALTSFPDAMLIPLHVWKREDEFEKDRWVSYIDPLAVVSKSAQIGRGCVIYPHCFIGADARLEDGVFVLAGAVINHDCHIGKRAVLTSHVSLAGGVVVGPRAYIGQAATVRQFVKLGEGSFIGMGSVVLRDVANGETVIGNPARQM